MGAKRKLDGEDDHNNLAERAMDIDSSEEAYDEGIAPDQKGTWT